MGLELTAWTAAASRRLNANTRAAQRQVMFCCTRPSLGGILSHCKIQKQLCALENATQVSIGTGVSVGWRNYPFTNSLYCSFRGAGNSILICFCVSTSPCGFLQMRQQASGPMSRWWTAATWRRSWSTDWHGSGRSLPPSLFILLFIF